jgi:hypothetical protein
MARKALKTSDGEGFLRATWDLEADMRAVYGVESGYTVRPSKRRGVFIFALRAYTPSEGGESVQRAAYTCEYPTAQVASLEACLYRAMLKLDFQLEMQLRYPEGKA